MLGGSGRWGAIAAGVLGVVLAAAAEPVIPPVEALPNLVPPGEEPPAVKDLTPPGFGTYLPHATAHASDPGVPGNLRPTAGTAGGWYTSVEALVLRPRRGDFDYVVNNHTQNLTVGGAVESLNYELRGGVRANLGYRFDHSPWDVAVGYTYFRSSGSGAVTADPGAVLYPTLTRPGLTDQVLAAAASASLEYNVFDLELGRRAVVDEHLAVRTFGGLRFASIRQDFDALYDGLDARRAAVTTRSNFTGFGPVLGGEAVLAGWRGFHVYARGNVGLLTGMSNNPLVETNDGGRTQYADVGYDVRQVVPTAGLGVGGGWQYRTVTVRVGYEITQYFNLIRQPRFVDDVAAGKFVGRPADFSLEGLFAQVGLSF